MEITLINSWQQVTLRKFIELMKLDHNDDDPVEYSRRVVKCLYDLDPDRLPYTVYLSIIRGLEEFVSQPITGKLTKDAKYRLGDTTYTLDIRPANFSTAQYIDFTTYAKQPDRYADMVSAVLIPEGHMYNDGYDMEEVKRDILSMPVTEVMGIVHFFVKWSKASIVTILRFLTSRRVLRGMDREKAKKLREEVRRLSRCMASFPSCSRTASSPTRH